MLPKLIYLPLLFFISVNSSLIAQQTRNKVHIVGAMKDVMWKGQLHGKIYLDTLENKTHLYGMGPVEYLTGEILIIDGKSYKSTVVSNTKLKVEESYNIKAPFFGFANIEKWKEQTLPDSLQTMPQLENYLNNITQSAPRPFIFKLSGVVDQANVHVVNLPKGTAVSSPEDAHKGKQNYELNNVQSDIIGFFSTEHQTIFTHRNTFLHMHLITADRQKMGHLDKALFKKGAMKLYLPAE